MVFIDSPPFPWSPPKPTCRTWFDIARNPDVDAMIEVMRTEPIMTHRHRTDATSPGTSECVALSRARSTLLFDGDRNDCRCGRAPSFIARAFGLFSAFFAASNWRRLWPTRSGGAKLRRLLLRARFAGHEFGRNAGGSSSWPKNRHQADLLMGVRRETALESLPTATAAAAARGATTAGAQPSASLPRLSIRERIRACRGEVGHVLRRGPLARDLLRPAVAISGHGRLLCTADPSGRPVLRSRRARRQPRPLVAQARRARRRGRAAARVRARSAAAIRPRSRSPCRRRRRSRA